METIFGRAVFAAGGTEYVWDDIVLAADLRGDWSGVCERVRQGIACLEKLNEEEGCLSEEEVDAAADEFRYERDLVSAQEMEEWLDRWGLTVESWMDYIRSSLLRRKWSDQLPDLMRLRRPGRGPQATPFGNPLKASDRSPAQDAKPREVFAGSSWPQIGIRATSSSRSPSSCCPRVRPSI